MKKNKRKEFPHIISFKAKIFKNIYYTYTVNKISIINILYCLIKNNIISKWLYMRKQADNVSKLCIVLENFVVRLSNNVGYFFISTSENSYNVLLIGINHAGNEFNTDMDEMYAMDIELFLKEQKIMDLKKNIYNGVEDYERTAFIQL